MTLTDNQLNQIGDSLVTGITTRRRRRQRALVALPALAVAASAAAFALRTDPAPAYAVDTLDNGTIEVEIYPNFDNADALRDDLVARGVNAEVVHLLTHPSLDGTAVVSAYEWGRDSSPTVHTGSRLTVDPAVSNVEIVLHTTAPAGTLYQVGPSIFHPEQPLAGMHCAYDHRPMTTQDIETALHNAGLHKIEWEVFTDTDDPGVQLSDTHNVRPEGEVQGARFFEAETVRVFVYDSGRPASEAISMYSGLRYSDAPTCTPELAARWQPTG